MGLLAPDYGEVAGYRHAIGADNVAILTNITPEFSRSVGGRTVAERAASAAFMGVEAHPHLRCRGRASARAWTRSGKPRRRHRDVPVLANTGVTHETVDESSGSPTAPSSERA